MYRGTVRLRAASSAATTNIAYTVARSVGGHDVEIDLVGYLAAGAAPLCPHEERLPETHSETDEH